MPPATSSSGASPVGSTKSPPTEVAATAVPGSSASSACLNVLDFSGRRMPNLTVVAGRGRDAEHPAPAAGVGLRVGERRAPCTARA